MYGREVQMPIGVMHMFGLPTGSGQPTNVPVCVKELRAKLTNVYDSPFLLSRKDINSCTTERLPFVKGDKV